METEMIMGLETVVMKTRKLAKLYNYSKNHPISTELIDHFEDELKGMKEAVDCFRGWSLMWDFDRLGMISKVYATYDGRIPYKEMSLEVSIDETE